MSSVVLGSQNPLLQFYPLHDTEDEAQGWVTRQAPEGLSRATSLVNAAVSLNFTGSSITLCGWAVGKATLNVLFDGQSFSSTPSRGTRCPVGNHLVTYETRSGVEHSFTARLRESPVTAGHIMLSHVVLETTWRAKRTEQEQIQTVCSEEDSGSLRIGERSASSQGVSDAFSDGPASVNGEYIGIGALLLLLVVLGLGGLSLYLMLRRHRLRQQVPQPWSYAAPGSTEAPQANKSPLRRPPQVFQPAGRARIDSLLSFQSVLAIDERPAEAEQYRPLEVWDDDVDPLTNLTYMYPRLPPPPYRL